MKPISNIFALMLCCLVLTWPVGTLAFSFDLGDLKKLTDDIRKIRGKVSTEEEIQMGGNLISGLLGAAPLVDDPELQRYINDVGFWVASQSARKDLPWRFGVIDSDGINAFAAPGGYILITLGLLDLLENEAQLAGVLAHEISHVVMKHHLKALQKTMKRDFWANLGARLVVDDEEDRKRLEKLVNLGVQLYATGLDRSLEYDADVKGVVLAARSGYDPYALLDVLTTLDSINPEADALTVMLKTHPPIADRLIELATTMDGKLDQYASGQTNQTRFLEVAGNINPSPIKP
ncbi:MAG: M48 family metalloprotease [Gammaproteobacteria bacterium]